MNESSSHLHKWKVPKTVQVMELGADIEKAELQWLVLQGYAQNPEKLAKVFHSLTDRDNIIIPEATSRFYRKGYEGEVVSSWMTSRYREDEIKDQQTYLNSVYDKLLNRNDTPLIILAYSQGTATALRWLDKNELDIAACAVYAGWPPDDVNYKSASWKDMTHYYLLGDNDYFIQGNRLEELKQKEYFKQLDPEWMDFVGPHEVLGQVLETLRDRFFQTLSKR